MAITLYKVIISSNGKLSIQKRHYVTFENQYSQGAYGTQRFGEAFYQHFNLARLKDQSKVGNLFAKDGEIAKANILAIFDILE